MDQILVLTKANLRSRYRGTWTGFFWTILNPLAMFGAQSFAFSYILKIRIENYSLFLLSGLLPWLFITQTLDMGSSILKQNGRLLKSLPVPPLILILAAVLENFFTFVITIFLVIFFCAFFYSIPIWVFILLPFAMLVLLLGTAALVSWIAMAQVFFQDLRFIFNFILSISFFFTPIFYDSSIVPENLRWLSTVNVFYHLISPCRELLHGQNFANFSSAMAKTILVDLAIALGALWYWRRKGNELYARL